MSVYLETSHHNNYSQCLPRCEPKANKFFQKTLETPWIWQARSRQRKHLASLDDRMLKDIGLTADDVRRECAKPFWR